MYVVAGPNGAGKSTYSSRARRILGLEPIDADTIQREAGLSSSAAWSEGLRRCREAIANRTSFLVETTLAGSNPERPSTLRLMCDAKRQGFRIDLTFIALENADAHVLRVADRVAAGLHGIPEHAVRERYGRSLVPAGDALHIADHALLIDNSSAAHPFREIAEFDGGKLVAQAMVPPFWLATVLIRYIEGIGENA